MPPSGHVDAESPDPGAKDPLYFLPVWALEPRILGAFDLVKSKRWREGSSHETGGAHLRTDLVVGEG